MIPIGLFAKPPYPGLVKTRLIPDIGANKAARVYRYCLEYTLDVVRHSGLEYHCYLSEECDDSLFQEEQCQLQKGADLGAKMHNALKGMLNNNSEGAIIIGSDCLEMRPQHLRQAAQALANHELVLLPTIDGGFALIGCTKVNQNLFRKVEWGSDRVLKQTLANAKQLNYRVSLLETLRDVDRLQDLEHYPELLALIASS